MGIFAHPPIAKMLIFNELQNTVFIRFRPATDCHVAALLAMTYSNRILAMTYSNRTLAMTYSNRILAMTYSNRILAMTYSN